MVIQGPRGGQNTVVSFAHVDKYAGTRLGLNLGEVRAGETRVVESPRRLRAEQNYGYVHGLWWLWLADRRAVLSVPPGAGNAIQAILGGIESEASIFDGRLAEALRGPVDEVLLRTGLPATDRVLCDLVFACNKELVRHHPMPDCRRLVDESVPAAEGLHLPTQCFPDGVVYGVVRDNQVVSVAYAHRTGVMEDIVADVGVQTAAGHRRRGHAQAAVSALVAHFTERHGEARYGSSPGNKASIATAESVGFVPYGKTLILSVSRESGRS